MPAARRAVAGRLFAVCVTTFMLLVDITIVNVALPSIQRSLRREPLGARVGRRRLRDHARGADPDRGCARRQVRAAGDLHRRHRASSARRRSSAASPGTSRRSTWRVRLQGIGGAALFATALALIGAEYQGAERGRAIAAWGSTVGFAVAAGPLLGGLITDSFGWRWIFFVNVPVGAVAIYRRDPARPRVARPERLPHRRRRARLLLGFAVPDRVRAAPRQRRRLGQRADRRLARRRPRAARRLRRRRDPAGTADARRLALPAAGVRRRAARDVLHRRRHVRALPVPLDLPAGHRPQLAARRRPALPADHRLRLLRAAR